MLFCWLEHYMWPFCVAWASPQHGSWFYSQRARLKLGSLYALASEVRQGCICCILFTRSESLRLASFQGGGVRLPLWWDGCDGLCRAVLSQHLRCAPLCTPVRGSRNPPGGLVGRGVCPLASPDVARLLSSGFIPLTPPQYLRAPFFHTLSHSCC